MGRYRELRVWRDGMSLVKQIYEITNRGVFSKDYGLKDQIRRAAVSIPSNIAEGDELQSQKQGIHFLYIAKGSNAELRTQLEIAKDIGYLEKDDYEFLSNLSDKIGASLTNLIKARQRLK